MADDINILSAKLCEVLARLEASEKECERLQKIIDSRPAINAGLPQTYIDWSKSIYELEFAHAAGIKQ